MIRTVATTALAALLCAATARSQASSILEFHDHADSMALYPPVDKPLRILCRHAVEGKFVTFLAFGGDSLARIASVTTKPLGDPAKDISLVVDFKEISPTAGAVTTWGYLYDRNGDGAVDYLALVGGAAAYKPADFPESLPKRIASMSRENIDYFLGRCRIIFNHYADDNFDGKIDALVQVDMDPTRDWVERRLLVRSSKFVGTFDDVRAFRAGLQMDAIDTVKHTAKSVPYFPVGKPRSVIDQNMIAEKTAILSLLNRAAEACGLTAGRFPRR